MAVDALPQQDVERVITCSQQRRPTQYPSLQASISIFEEELACYALKPLLFEYGWTSPEGSCTLSIQKIH